ncbi:MAG: DUF4097 family beta strand repeat-containing protein [Candidatus Baltobacteraceae bacterium]
MSRASIVALLVAAEILIAGMAVYAVSGAGTTFASGMHRLSFTPAQVEPISAGDTPNVVIDDRASKVSVGLSGDGRVHVRDLTEMRGAIYSNASYPQLRVARTNDGVRVDRPAAPRLSVVLFGADVEEIQVEVPSGSHVEIAHCAGAEIDGVTGGVSVSSQDGRVKLSDLSGTIDARSDDGRIIATNVRADRLTMESADGRLVLLNVSAGSLTARTHDGRIEANGLNLTGSQPDSTLHTDDGPLQINGAFAPSGSYELSTNDGSIELHLARDADLAIAASTGSGRVVVDGSSYESDDSSQRTIRLGSGAGSMKLATADGSIHILTNGAVQQ